MSAMTSSFGPSGVELDGAVDAELHRNAFVEALSAERTSNSAVETLREWAALKKEEGVAGKLYPLFLVPHSLGLPARHFLASRQFIDLHLAAAWALCGSEAAGASSSASSSGSDAVVRAFHTLSGASGVVLLDSGTDAEMLVLRNGPSEGLGRERNSCSVEDFGRQVDEKLDEIDFKNVTAPASPQGRTLPRPFILRRTHIEVLPAAAGSAMQFRVHRAEESESMRSRGGFTAELWLLSQPLVYLGLPACPWAPEWMGSSPAAEENPQTAQLQSALDGVGKANGEAAVRRRRPTLVIDQWPLEKPADSKASDLQTEVGAQVAALQPSESKGELLVRYLDFAALRGTGGRLPFTHAHPLTRPIFRSFDAFAARFSTYPKSTRAIRFTDFVTRSAALFEMLAPQLELQTYGEQQRVELSAEDRIGPLLTLEDCVERYIILNIFELAYEIDDALAAQDAKLSAKIAGLSSWVGPANLEIPSENVNLATLELAAEQLRCMAAFHTPRDKLSCVVRACELLLHGLCGHAGENGGGTSEGGADDFFPLLIVAVLRACPSRVKADIQYISSYRAAGWRLRLGRDGYFLTTLVGCIQYLETLEPHELVLDAAPSAASGDAGSSCASPSGSSPGESSPRSGIWGLEAAAGTVASSSASLDVPVSPSGGGGVPGSVSGTHSRTSSVSSLSDFDGLGPGVLPWGSPSAEQCKGAIKRSVGMVVDIANLSGFSLTSPRVFFDNKMLGGEVVVRPEVVPPHTRVCWAIQQGNRWLGGTTGLFSYILTPPQQQRQGGAARRQLVIYWFVPFNHKMLRNDCVLSVQEQSMPLNANLKTALWSLVPRTRHVVDIDKDVTVSVSISAKASVPTLRIKVEPFFYFDLASPASHT